MKSCGEPKQGSWGWVIGGQPESPLVAVACDAARVRLTPIAVPESQRKEMWSFGHSGIRRFLGHSGFVIRRFPQAGTV